jgi:CRISPR-associated exonuclease Cas4
MRDLRITGTLIGSYMICKREMWLMSRNVLPDQENPYLELGRFISETSYERERKQIHLENVVIDLTRLDEDKIVVGEIKKSSRAIDAARMQLCYYLYILKDYGIEARGELLFPKEKKREPVLLTDSMINEIEKAMNNIIEIAAHELPPPAVKIGYCTHCAYREFCWS